VLSVLIGLLLASVIGLTLYVCDLYDRVGVLDDRLNRLNAKLRGGR